MTVSVALISKALGTSRQLTRQTEAGTLEQALGPRLTNPDTVEDVIRRAQLAILNPSVPSKDFVGYIIPSEPEEAPLGSTKQLNFSSNVIVLEITGPNVTDLTLVDLPGIIQNVGDGEDVNDIKVIEDMVKGYIEKDCLILLVLTMKGMSTSQRLHG